MSENIKEQWWVTLWTKGRVIQERLAGSYDNVDEARYEALRQVNLKPEGSIIGLCTSILKSKDE